MKVNYRVNVQVKSYSGEGGGAFPIKFNFNFHPIFLALTVQNAMIQDKSKFKMS